MQWRILELIVRLADVPGEPFSDDAISDVIVELGDIATEFGARAPAQFVGRLLELGELTAADGERFSGVAVHCSVDACRTAAKLLGGDVIITAVGR
jgi:hypothetical protein